MNVYSKEKVVPGQEGVKFAKHNISKTEALAFDTDKANKFLDILSIQLSVVTPSYEVLEDAIAKLMAKQEQADACILEAEDKLKELSVHDVKNDKTSSTQHELYIQNKIAEFEKRRSDCKLIYIRTEESIDAFSKTASYLARSKLFYSDSSALDNLMRLRSLAILVYKEFNFQQFYVQSGIDRLTIINSMYLLIFMLLGYLTGLRLRRIIKKRIGILHANQQHIPTLFTQGILSVAEKHEIYIIQACFVAAYFSLSSLGISLTPLGVIASFAIVFYILYISMIRFFFSPPPPAKSIINIAPEIEKPLIKRLKTLGIVCVLGYLVHAAIEGQNLPEQALLLPITFFITILTFNLISVLWLVNRIKVIRARFSVLRYIINFILTSILVGTLITNWIGLSHLSIYLLKGIAFTLICLTVFWTIFKLVHHTLSSLSGCEEDWQQNIRKKLGLKISASIPELLWIRFIIYSVMWICFLFLALMSAKKLSYR